MYDSVLLYQAQKYVFLVGQLEKQLKFLLLGKELIRPECQLYRQIKAMSFPNQMWKLFLILCRLPPLA